MRSKESVAWRHPRVTSRLPHQAQTRLSFTGGAAPSPEHFNFPGQVASQFFTVGWVIGAPTELTLQSFNPKSRLFQLLRVGELHPVVPLGILLRPLSLASFLPRFRATQSENLHCLMKINRVAAYRKLTSPQLEQHQVCPRNPIPNAPWAFFLAVCRVSEKLCQPD